MDLRYLKVFKRFSVVISTITLFFACGKELPRTVHSSDGVPISFEVHGAGKTALVFVHGWSCDRSYWKEQVEPFSSEFQVVTIDLAGHGDSGLDRREWTIEAYSEDVAAVVKELGLQHVFLIGHSMGGDVITAAARLLPGRVQGLVWVDVYKQLKTFRTPEEVQTMLTHFSTDFKERASVFVRGMFPKDADQSLVDRVADDMSSAPHSVALAAMKAAITYQEEITAALQELKLPVVAINPETPPTDNESLRRYGVSVVLMPGVGHFPMMENPNRFNQLLLDVIEKLNRQVE